MKRKPLIAGNWKMYKTAKEAGEYLRAFIPLISHAHCRIFLSVPYTTIEAAAEAAKGSPVVIGAQNMSDAAEGAFTGEISSKMLQEAGAQFVILGHSERRQLFGETNGFIQRKVKRALAEGLTPILCIGETLEEREKGHTHAVLKAQLQECLKDLSASELHPLIVAYEPVWAIGTGKTATPEMAQEAHHVCRSFIAKTWGAACAEGMALLYGGSVKPENIEELMAQPDIDGALVGGAALKPEIFAQLITAIR